MPQIDPSRLRAARERRLLTQAELAARIGSAESTVVNIERGTHQPRISTVRRLADALGIDPGSLFVSPGDSAAEPGEAARLVARAWEAYQRVPRIRWTADLHGLGFAFGDAPVVTVYEGERLRELPVLAPPEFLREIGRGLYVAGEASAALTLGADALRLDPGDGCRFRFDQTDLEPGRPGGRVWPTIVEGNYDAITSPFTPSSVKDTLLVGMLHSAILSTEAAARLTADQIYSLTWYYGAAVNQMRREFEIGLSSCARALTSGRVVAVDWPALFYPAVEGRDGILGAGNVYRVFRAAGIDLARLKSGALELADDYAQLGMLSRSTREAIARSYDLP